MGELKYTNEQIKVSPMTWVEDQPRTFFTIFDEDGERTVEKFPWEDNPEYRFASSDYQHSGRYPRPRRK